MQLVFVTLIVVAGFTLILRAFLLHIKELEILVKAKDLFEAGGAIMETDAPLYTIHAFICGLMPNVIIDKGIKLSAYLKK